MAGVVFAFSRFVLRALAKLPPADAIAAMQRFNVWAAQTWFFAAIIGTAVGPEEEVAFRRQAQYSSDLRRKGG